MFSRNVCGCFRKRVSANIGRCGVLWFLGFDVEISSNTPSRELYRIILIDSNEKNPDDGHYRPKHVVLSKNITSNYTYIVVLLTTYPLISLHTHSVDGTLQSKEKKNLGIINVDSAILDQLLTKYLQPRLSENKPNYEGWYNNLSDIPRPIPDL